MLYGRLSYVPFKNIIICKEVRIDYVLNAFFPTFENLHSHNRIHQLNFLHEKTFLIMQFSAYGRPVAAGSGSGQKHLWGCD